jgi:uncharacterized protein YfdQ (DUF2303 family)
MADEQSSSALATMSTDLKLLHGAEIRTVSPSPNQAITVAILPKDKRLEDLQPIFDKYRAYPRRRVGSATLTDLASMIAHIERFATDRSAVFADPNREAPKLTVVFDYHPKEGIGDDVGAADWMQHRAVYAPTLSDAWTVWDESDSTQMAQGDFAHFIEDRLMDLVVPDLDDPTLKTFAALVQGKFASPSDLVALSRGLAVNVDTKVRQAVQLNTGAIAVQYEEQHQDGEGAPINIANLFQICVPVFYGGANYRMAVRLRYRLSGQRLAWHYSLVRPELVFDHAFMEIVDKVRSETSLPVFLGTPEK